MYLIDSSSFSGSNRSMSSGIGGYTDSILEGRIREEYIAQVRDIPEDRFSDMPSMFHNFTFVQNHLLFSSLVSRFENRKNNAAYKDYLWSRRVGLLNFVSSIESTLAIPSYLMFIAEKIAGLFGNSSVASDFATAGAKTSVLVSNPVIAMVSKVSPWLMIVNALIQIKRKLGMISEIDAFLAKQGLLNGSEIQGSQAVTKEFLVSFKREYFSITKDEERNILFNTELSAKEIEAVKNEAVNGKNFEQMKATKTAEKVKIYRNSYKLDKLHKLSRIIGKEATQSLAEGGLDALLFNVNDKSQFEQVFASTQKIILRAKTKRTAEKIDIAVQAIFFIVAVGMLFGNPLGAVVIAGFALWIGLAIYVSKRLGKIDFAEGVIKPPVQGNEVPPIQHLKPKEGLANPRAVETERSYGGFIQANLDRSLLQHCGSQAMGIF